jgi:alkanesulfonate monooxygenase SsuD/methylene tetrahydromethanopterin reductase-like flavin-dependent oxidoreductase (luciferase family)
MQASPGGEAFSYGISLPNRAVVFGVPADNLLQTAIEADASGFFESVWVGDNLFSRARMESIVTLAGIAAVTSRVRLGTVCMASFPMRNPLLLSIQWSSLDVLSKGRTILAVCLGDSAKAGGSFGRELQAMGVKSAERVARLEEGVEILRTVWREGPATHSGLFYEFADIEVLPKPVQSSPPILIAANPPKADAMVEERSLRRVARLADGWQTYGHPPALLNRRWELIKKYATDYGRKEMVTDCSMHLMINVGRDTDACKAEALEFFHRYYGDEGEMHTLDLYGTGAFGSAAEVANGISRYRGSGVTRLILRFVSLDQRTQMERFVQDVVPMLDV